jgi:DHA1 family bicyclomycin/chloramphenicol resistance-like MFS transporter
MSAQSSPPGFLVVIFVMVLAESASIMSTDLYTPSLPDLVAWFDATPELLKLTISINVIAYGAAQIIYGPLADRFGRRPVMLTAISLFILSSILCAFARTIDELLIARVLQGLFASAEAVICLAVFRDLFDEKQQIKAYAIYGMAIALAPAVAPILGGYIHIYLGWQYNFYLTAALASIAALLIFLLLPESGTPDRGALAWRVVAGTYVRIVRNRQFHVYALLAGFSLGMIYCFITAAPFILIDYFGVAVEHFGYYQAVIVVAYFAGATLTTKLVEHYSAIRLLNLGLAIMLLGAVLIVALEYTDRLDHLTLALGNLLIAFGLGPIFSVVPTRAMSAIEGSSGSTASAFGFIEIGMAGIVAALVSVFHDGTAMPYAIIVASTAIGAIWLGVIANRLDRRDDAAMASVWD